MIIAISSSGNSIESMLDQRFGRCAFFVIHDTETGKVTFQDNSEISNYSGGAGIQAAAKVVDANVQVVITGHCGPKAFRALNASGVKVYTASDCTIEQSIAQYNNNELQSLTSPDVEGHWK